MLYFCMDNFLIVPRQILAILLLLSFAYRPVFQIGEISYYQFNLDYIIKSYCINKNKPALHCNGKCYLMQQLEKSNNLGNSKASVNIAASFLPAYFHIPPDYQLIHTFFKDCLTIFTFNIPKHDINKLRNINFYCSR